MSSITLAEQQKTALVEKLQDYFVSQLEQELGQFDAEFLLDFIAKEMGAVFYNQGLYDAQAVLSLKMDDIQDAILQIEKPVEV